MSDDEESRVLCPLRDEVEAQALREMLKQRGITAAIIRMSDTAYPGVFDRGKPWGVLRVRASDLSLSKWLLDDFQRAEILEEPVLPAPKESPPQAPQTTLSPVSWLLLAVSIGLFVGVRHCASPRGEDKAGHSVDGDVHGSLVRGAWALRCA